MNDGDNHLLIGGQRGPLQGLADFVGQQAQSQEPPVFRMGGERDEHPDQLKRIVIPKRKDLPTQYHVLRNLLMVKPLDDIEKIGELYLPTASRIQLNEGHILEVGGDVDEDTFPIGACVTWEPHNETRFECDDKTSKFVVIAAGAALLIIPPWELDPTNYADPNAVDTSAITKQ